MQNQTRVVIRPPLSSIGLLPLTWWTQSPGGLACLMLVCSKTLDCASCLESPRNPWEINQVETEG